MKVLVCGSRYWVNIEPILDRLRKLDQATVVITGGANGADLLAESASRLLNLKCIVIRAEWNKYGLAAGPIRNRKMLDMRPDLVIAFHENLSSSKGTMDTIKEAERRGISTEIISGGQNAAS